MKRIHQSESAPPVHEPASRRHHGRLIRSILAFIGFLTVLYLLIVYGLMPVLAMLTKS